MAIIAALCSDVDLLILDEPTSGLDPVMEAVFQDEIGRAKAEGRSILLSTHILSEAEALADRLGIIRRGWIVETGSLAELRHRTRSVVEAALGHAPAGAELRHFHDIRTVPGRSGVDFAAVVDRESWDDAMRALASCGIRSLSVRPPSLEDVFLRHYEGATS